MKDEGEHKDEHHRHRVRKRIRIDAPRLSFRQRMKAIWKRHRHWMMPLAILVIGSALGWLGFWLNSGK
jgi:hypothetical protein